MFANLDLNSLFDRMCETLITFNVSINQDIEYMNYFIYILFNNHFTM